jgi:hypothetical protein
MVVITTPDEEYPVPYGIPSTATCYINGTEYFFQSFKVINKLNQPSSFEVSLMDVTSSDTNIAYGMPIMFFIGNKLFLKGRMDRPKFMTDGYANVKGLGMEAALKDKIVTALTSPATAYGTNRFQYTNVNSNTIVNQICSLNGDGVAPWVVQPLVNTNFGFLSMRFENVDKMTAVATTSDSCTNDVGSSYDWWISQDINEAPNAFATDYFNISTRRGISSPTYTFYVSGDNLQNAVSTDREQDYESTATYVNINGYGDGINQIRTSCFNNTGDGVSSPRYTLTTQAITATYKGNMTVADSSKLTAGIAIMGEERVTFTVVNGTTINLTERGTGSTTATTHPHGIYIANWIDPAESNIANWETGSAMKTQDRKEVSLDATNIIDIDTLQLIATRTLLDRMNVPERITLNPEDPFDATTNVNLGDAVTIVDADVGLNGTYRIVSEELDYGDSGVTITYEVSNRHLYLLESMNQIKTTGQNEAVASQGATNCWQLPVYENCSNSKPLNIRFYIPTEAVAINKLTVSFKMKNYRAYETTTAAQTTTDGTGYGVLAFESGNIQYLSGKLVDWYNEATGTARTMVTDLSTSTMVRVNDMGNDGCADNWSTGCTYVYGWTYYNVKIPSKTIWSTPYYSGIVCPTVTTGSFYKTYIYITFYNRYSAARDFVWTIREDATDGTILWQGTTNVNGWQTYRGEVTGGGTTTNYANHSFYLVLSSPTFSVTDWDDSGIKIEAYTYPTTTHTHDITYGIYDSTAYTSNVAVAVSDSAESSWTTITASPFTSDTNDIDLTNNGTINYAAGNWYTLRLTPSTGLMRIEANAFIQVFIRSR